MDHLGEACRLLDESGETSTEELLPLNGRGSLTAELSEVGLGWVMVWPGFGLVCWLALVLVWIGLGLVKVWSCVLFGHGLVLIGSVLVRN